MHFSLILATVGRVEEVGQFLKSLDGQTHRTFDLIVVDQNEDGRLLPILKSYRERFLILHLKSQPGLSRARNVGLPHARGDVVAFPDDDCSYSPGLLKRVCAFLESHPQMDGLTGRVVDQHGRSGTARFDDEPGLLDQSNVWQRTSSITLFLRRRIVERIGGFDEELGVGAGTIWGGGEDIDYPLRALRAGFKLYYSPEITAFHPSPQEYDYAKLASRAYGYGAGIGRVWRKHRYPLQLVAYYLLRPAGGAALSLASGDRAKALYHFSAFRGRLRGWLYG